MQTTHIMMMMMMMTMRSADEPGNFSGPERGAERSREALQTEVWVLSRQTRTCGQGQGSSHPHLCSPAPLHTGSPNQHTCTSTQEQACTHTRQDKKIPGCCSRADPVTVPLQQPCSQHSDDLLLELVNTGHPERERWAGVEGTYTCLEAALHWPTVMSCDLTYWS